MSLFVKDEEDMDVDTSVIHVKEEQIESNDLLNSPPTATASSATPEINMGSTEDIVSDSIERDNSNDDDDDDDDDPIINEIPIHLNNYVDDQELYLFQYPTKKQSQYANSSTNLNISQTRIKTQSGVVEVKIPLQTGKFFDEGKSIKWDNTRDQILKGVFVESRGYYVGIMKEDGLHLNQLDKTSQLRSSFKYIDDLKLQKQQRERDLYNRLNSLDDPDEMGSKASSSHVVQMSVKSSGENVPRLGGALQKKKLEEDEPFIDYEYFNHASCEQRDKLLDQSGSTLTCKVTKDEYLTSLLQEL